MPSMNASGTNTTTGVSVEPTSGPVISFADRPIAATGESPAAAWVAMLSTTTIASSITSPTAAAIPPSVIRLKLVPSSFIATSAARIVTGMTTTATAAVPTVAPHRCPLLRNPTMIPTDKSSPNRMLSHTLPTDSFTRIDWS